MSHPTRAEQVETIVIGGGQAGLATAQALQRRDRPCVILEASDRVGDVWRQRWDSLRLFTPAKFSRLPGMDYPDRAWAFATKDEFAGYLEDYAGHFGFDVRTRARADRIERTDDRYLVTAGEQRFLADHVVLATGAYQEPKVPVFAPELAPDVVQIHSSAYRNPGQLQDGDVLVVGAGNSGAEIALELAASHPVHLAGSSVVFPVRPGSLPSRVVMPAFLFVAKHLLTTRTPIGRRMRPKAQVHGAPTVRVKPGDLAAAGVRRTARMAGVQDGRPLLDDGSVLDVANVIWCTGFRSDFSWIDLPSFASGEEPAHDRGVLRDESGVYLIGQRFQYALASSFIGGVGRDADHVAKVIAKRTAQRQRDAARDRQAARSEVAATR